MTMSHMYYMIEVPSFHSPKTEILFMNTSQLTVKFFSKLRTAGKGVCICSCYHLSNVILLSIFITYILAHLLALPKRLGCR